MLTNALNQNIQLKMQVSPPAKRTKLSHAIITTSSTLIQPASLVKTTACLPSTTREHTCLDVLRTRLEELTKFTNQKKFDNKQVWVEELLATCPVEELRKVEMSSIIEVFEDFPVSQVTIGNAFRAITAIPDEEQTGWFNKYVTAQPFNKDNNKDTETKWVKKMLEKRKAEGKIFTAPVLRHLMITINGKLTSVCLQKSIRIIAAKISSADTNKSLEIFSNTVSDEPVWRLHDMMTHKEFPPKLRNEANMFCLFKGKEQEYGINRNIISGAVILAHAKLEPGSPLDQWFEGWYTQNKMTPDFRPDTQTIAFTLLNYADISPLPAMSKLTVGNLFIFLKRKGLAAKFESTEDTTKIFNLAIDAFLSTETEKQITPHWEKYAKQQDITLERKMGKTMEESGCGKAVLARYMLKKNISFTIALIFAAQRIIDQDPLEIGTIVWLKSELENKIGYSSKNKSQWLKNILQKKERPQEITEIVRKKLTEKLLRAIWQTSADISYTTLDRLVRELKRSPIFSNIPPVEIITETEPAPEPVSELPSSIPVPCMDKPLSEEEKSLYFLEMLKPSQNYATPEPFYTLETDDIAIGSLEVWPFS